MQSGSLTARDFADPEQHPAWQRFIADHPADTNSLLIHAPAGTGRELFAHSWGGEVHDLGGRTALELNASVAEAKLSTSTRDRHVYIATTPADAWAIIQAIPCAAADARDLMLTETSIHAAIMAARPGDADALDRAQQIFDDTGGWHSAVQILVAEPDNRVAALRAIAVTVVPWMLSIAPAAPWAALALLPALDDDLIEALHREGGAPVPTVEELHRAGLAHRSATGDWRMPNMVRAAISDWARKTDQDGYTTSADIAVAVLGEVGQVEHAVDTAVHSRSWTALRGLLIERWAELFTSNPRRLARIVARLPRVIQEQTDELALIVRVLSAAGKEQMHLPLPSIEPDYSRDATAQHLRARMEHLSRRPSLRTLAFGLLELAHLRLSAHYAESGDAAALLRISLDRVLDRQRVSGALTALVEVHAGMSLHLDDRRHEALAAYAAGSQWAASTGHSFLQADATSKLALLSGQIGNTDSLQHWLDEHDRVVTHVAWGRRMVNRSAILARGLLAVSQFDSDDLADVIANLPTQIDTDEFWAAHVWLVAMHRVFAGTPEDALTALNGVRTDRPYAARSVLSRRLLAHAELFTRLAGGDLAAADSSTAWPEVAVLDAVRHLALGETDRALAVIGAAFEHASGARHRDALQYLSIYVRSNGQLGEGALAEIRHGYRTSGELGDIFPLHLLGQSPVLEHAGIISARERQRLDMVPMLPTSTEERPVLTAREAEILGLLRRGHNRREIAAHTHRSENTVKSQMRGLYRKLGAASRDDALARARRLGY